MNFHALLNVLNRYCLLSPFLDGVSSQVDSSGDTRLGKSSGWFAEKLISLVRMLAAMTGCDVANARQCLIGDPGLYDAGVSLDRIGG